MAENSKAISVKKSATQEFQSGFQGIRVSPNSYFAVLFVITFFSGLLTYLQYDIAGLSLFVGGWIVFPVLAWNDKIVLKGEVLTRTGLIPKLWSWFNNSPNRLKLSDIEQIETQALRALKRGGNVFYRYRTSVRGKNVHFAFASGGEQYRQLSKRIFSKVHEDVLDNRSLEIRDYLSDSKEALMKAEFVRIPSSAALELSVNEFQTNCKAKKTRRLNFEITPDSVEKANYLRQLANELRLSGYLLQSLEAFRRALLLNPADGYLVFEFSRCLHSFAGLEQNEKLAKRAVAALRLAEKLSPDNPQLLARIGESFFQFGDLQRAGKIFKKALEVDENNFRSARGLAEIALRDGKIAYVLHHLAVAYRASEVKSLKIWTQNESDYFSKLNSNELYMEAEIQRIDWLDSMQRNRNFAIRIIIFGFALILVGIFTEELVSHIGWAVSGISLLIWIVLLSAKNFFSERVPLDVFDDDDDEDDDFF